jgi:hypothetical protein
MMVAMSVAQPENDAFEKITGLCRAQRVKRRSPLLAGLASMTAGTSGNVEDFLPSP